jgi:CRISPR/Cas system-associated exonuclease Cas4 (RecB family)
MIRMVEAAAADVRLAEARAFIQQFAPSSPVLIVGSSRGAADDLARSVANSFPATFGLHRLSFTQLAARLATPVLAARGAAPVSYLGSEAVAARATFGAQRDSALDYFAPVARTPGFPRALARTLQEVRLARVSGDRLGRLPLGGRDLSVLLERFDDQFAAASATDRATLFAAATEGTSRHQFAGLPLLLLDVPMDSATEFDFLCAVVRESPSVLITVPFGDVAALGRLAVFGVEAEILEQHGTSDLTALRRNLFAGRRPPERTLAGDVRLFSAPGEGRECTEIARRILEEARRGVPFDEMAVLLRSPQNYLGLLEHACRRAAIPVWFDRGVTRPHPAGRAFLAMLGCAIERLSARRFAEYLSLGQVPQFEASDSGAAFVTPADDTFGRIGEMSTEHAAESSVTEAEGVDPVLDADDVAIVAGTLRAPWKWETLIVESAVIGGGAARWHRRLDGLAREYRLRIAEEARDDPDSPVAQRLTRDLRNLAHLRAFALPVIDRLASWPSTATWGEWLDLFEELAPRLLRYTPDVLRVFAELRPMSDIGPVALDEARDVLADRLLTLQPEPPRCRYGAVFVGSPHQARGRSFRVVFVPGLAERMFPQKPREDPMLLDTEMRKPLDAGLPLQRDRDQTERLLLRLAIGAPTERLWLSYSRLELAESRPRVPSFYALDVMRAITGRIPDHETLQEAAALEGSASLAWPAPALAERAVDDLEHDLAILAQLLAAEPRAGVRGHANYMLQLNDSLRRSVTTRWARARSTWSQHDGLVRLTSATRPALGEQRLNARPFSLSALQKFSTCPYQFLLSAIYRLEPNEEPEPLQRLDPLTRGAIFHEIQARFYRALQSSDDLPVTDRNMKHALGVLDATVAAVATEQHEQLAPAIERVWEDEMADISRDLRVWVKQLPATADWTPELFEFSFGLSDEGRDPRSVPDAVVLDERFILRGSVDLVERQTKTGLLRVTDHKTGKNRTTDKTIIGGGSILQPVLYSLAVEQAVGSSVAVGRLFYCTAAGGFTERPIPINDANRRSGLEALEIIDRAVELGFLPPAPSSGACAWCDFQPVCGPNEERRLRGKSPDKLADLLALRSMP